MPQITGAASLPSNADIREAGAAPVGGGVGRTPCTGASRKVEPGFAIRDVDPERHPRGRICKRGELPRLDLASLCLLNLPYRRSTALIDMPGRTPSLAA